MIPVTMKKDMVELLGRVMRWEGGEAEWNDLSFDEKMEFVESVLDYAVTEIRDRYTTRSINDENT